MTRHLYQNSSAMDLLLLHAVAAQEDVADLADIDAWIAARGIAVRREEVDAALLRLHKRRKVHLLVAQSPRARPDRGARCIWVRDPYSGVEKCYGYVARA